MKRERTKRQFANLLNKSLDHLSYDEANQLLGYVKNRERGMACNASHFAAMFHNKRLGDVLYKYDYTKFATLYYDWKNNGTIVIVEVL